MNTKTTLSSLAPDQPGDPAPVDEWVDWFWRAFIPGWIERARDPDGFGFFDLLDENAQPAQQHRRTLLAQARLLFTFSHLALKSDNQVYYNAARTTRDALEVFRKSPGTYCRARSASRVPTEDASDDQTPSYDQCFVILGLSTWARLNQNTDASAPEDDTEIEACWNTFTNRLTDPTTGLLLEHDALNNPSDSSAPCRAQNPHMHLYEAALQAFEMTGNALWLERAAAMRAKGLEYFYDRHSGTITEFIAPDLSILPGRDGQRREVGHQYEWAWLLYREIELGGDSHVKPVADAMLKFADDNGLATTGPMQGAAYDAVSADTSWCEERFLLWPQTEAIKTYAIRSRQEDFARNAERLLLLVFKRYFRGRAAFINQLDYAGKPVWTEALSRLLYHLVLALTEGARFGLWRQP